MLVPQSGGEAYSLYGVRGGVCGWRQRSDLGVLPTPSGVAVSKVNAQYSAFAPNILFLLQVPSKEEVGFFFISLHLQTRSVAQSCPTLCNPMNRSMPGLPVHHQLPEFTETHVHRVSDAIQPSHPLSSPSPPAPNPSQHQSLFQ